MIDARATTYDDCPRCGVRGLPPHAHFCPFCGMRIAGWSVDVRVPALSARLGRVVLSRWHVVDGSEIGKDQPICRIDSDRATIDLTAMVGGVLRRFVPRGAELRAGDILARIERSAADGHGARWT